MSQPSVDLDRQIKCVERELAMRSYVYKRNVELGKMAQSKADRETDEMAAVLETLKGLRDAAKR